MVYEALWSGQTVALKEFSPGFLFSAVRREIVLQARLRHPNIVQLTALCFSPLCILTEFVPHQSLHELVQPTSNSSRSFPWALRVRVAQDVAQALHYLHSLPIPVVHCDLKTPNILIASFTPSDPAVAKVFSLPSFPFPTDG